MIKFISGLNWFASGFCTATALASAFKGNWVWFAGLLVLALINASFGLMHLMLLEE